jgi:hypothetical protein
MIWGQLSKNLSEDPPPSQAISHAWWSTSVIPTYAGGVRRLPWEKVWDPIWKITKVKSTGGMVQVLACLPS